MFWLLAPQFSIAELEDETEMLMNIDGKHNLLIFRLSNEPDLDEWLCIDETKDCIEEDARIAIVNEFDSDQFPKYIFNLCPDIEHFEMTHTHLKSLESNDLTNAQKLLKLDLSYNEITTIENAAFDPAPRLTEIDLSFNLLTNFNEYIFTSYLIQYLYLHNNQLNMVNPIWFENLLYLRVLTLNNNQIHTIDCTMLEYWPAINQLNLHSNEITKIENAIQTPRSMQTFSIYDNPVAIDSQHPMWFNSEVIDVHNTTVEICRIQNRMIEIQAADNNIREINLDDLNAPELNALVTLNLANNRLQSIENVTHFYRLQYLDVSNNLLTEFDTTIFVNLKDLRHLDLKQNKLHRFGIGNVCLPNLKFLDLSDSGIAILDLTGVMSQLVTLNIDGNILMAASFTKQKEVDDGSDCLSDDSFESDTCNWKPDEHNQIDYNDPNEKNELLNTATLDAIYEHFRIMEKNMLDLIDARFNDVHKRLKRLEDKIVKTSNEKDEL